ncbi:MAG: hypothetical protein JKX70_05460 [Phycisphaerales bacterium]|nr:hypothetical protein [Phycisphaerales bacterium]
MGGYSDGLTDECLVECSALCEAWHWVEPLVEPKAYENLVEQIVSHLIAPLIHSNELGMILNCVLVLLDAMMPRTIDASMRSSLALPALMNELMIDLKIGMPGEPKIWMNEMKGAPMISMGCAQAGKTSIFLPSSMTSSSVLQLQQMNF